VSLRWRLLVAVGAVVLAPLTVMALLSGRITRVELDRLSVAEEGRRLESELDILAGWLEDAEPTERPGRVERWEGDFAALLFDAKGDLLATSEPRFRQLELRIDDRGVAGRSADGSHAFRLFVPSRELAGPGDSEAESAARLFVIPSPFDPWDRDAPERPASTAGRWLLVIFLALGAVALAVTATVARRLAGPLEDLTRAFQRNDLSVRVEVTGDDEVARLGHSFNQMAERLDRAERLRRDLAADVAHELRTPLTNLRCELESVQDGLSAVTPDWLASLHEEVLLLQRLVSDLQDLALAEAGQMRFDLQEVDPAAEVSSAVRALEARTGAQDGSPRIVVELPPLPTVQADPQRLRQVLTNLLDNAVRHTPAGGRVVVEGRVLGEGEGEGEGEERPGKEIELRVCDEGPGIPRERHRDVFERFVRLDASRQRATGGAGLGLAIVKQLVEAHGGRVGVESEPGCGAVFWVRWPVRSALTPGPSPSPSTRTTGGEGQVGTLTPAPPVRPAPRV